MADIFASNVAGTVSKRDAAATVHASDVAAGHAGNGALDRHMSDTLGFLDRSPDGSCGRADIRN
jgi:hypothetical protein